MSTYEFTFVVDGLSPLDPDHNDRLAAAGADDAMVFSDGDRTLISFYRDAASAFEAVVSAAHALERAYPDAGICRLDRDLVSATDIADRIGVSRETVRKWVTGERASGDGFPMPLGTVSGGTRIWEWAPVYYWLEGHGYDVDDDAKPLPLDVMSRFEARLMDRREAPVADLRVLELERHVRSYGRPASSVVNLIAAEERRSDYYLADPDVHVGLSGSLLMLQIKNRTADVG